MKTEGMNSQSIISVKSEHNMITINEKGYKELRCKNDSCRKLIAYEKIRVGRLCYICSRCGETNEFEFTMLKTKENNAIIQNELL
jgi:hypothetical protein